MLARLEREPELLERRDWVALQTVATAGRYLLYPLVATPQSYWRGEPDNAAFFMQTWVPVILVGGLGGPGAGLAAGSVAGWVCYVLAAVLNGENLLALHSKEVRVAWRRIANYSITSAIVGVFVAWVAQLLFHASHAIEQEQALLTRQTIAEERTRAAADIIVETEREVHSTVQRLSQIVERDAPPGEERNRMLAELRTIGTVQWSVRPYADTALLEVVEEVAAATGVDVNVEGVGHVALTPEDAETARLVLANAFRNAREHGKASDIKVQLSAAGGRYTLTVDDDGVGLAAPVRFRRGHGLWRVRSALDGLDGGLEVGPSALGGCQLVATWRSQDA